MHGQNLSEGNIPRQMWSLAWPLMLSVFFYALYSTVDAFWVSKLSAEAIAAVSISQVVLFVMVALSMGMTAGSGVLMAMSIGAKNMEEAKRILAQSFVLAGIAGIVFTVIAILFGSPLLKAAGATGAIFPLAMQYYTVTSFGLILLFVLMTIIFAFNAQGDNFTLTKLLALSTILNTVIDPLFIFGWKQFPAMGIQGAAIATLISQFVFIAAGIYVLSRPSMMVQLQPGKLGIKLASVKKVLSIGFPAALTNALGPLGTAVLLAIAASAFGESGAISASLAFRVEFFAFLPAIGYGFGGMAMLGQNIGAKNFARARQAFMHSFKIGFGSSAVIGIAAAIFALPLIALFTADPIVTQYTRLYLWSIPFTYGFMGITFIEAFAFQGIGRSWPGFWISMLRIAAVAAPVSLIMIHAFQSSILGVWIAIAMGNVVAGTAGYFWFRRTLPKIAQAIGFN
ncbi:MATE family efflux transporter [Candidatus Woesearchaeota archaeon]|nr:MATE family efflux transporter [Candidatus Woesearchaeota archaeon]